MITKKQKNFLYYLDNSMTELSISRKELAEHLGSSSATIARYLKEETFPKNTDKIVSYINERSVYEGFHHVSSEDFSDALRRLYKMFLNIVTQKMLADHIGVSQRIISECVNQNPDTVRPSFSTEKQKKLLDYYRKMSEHYGYSKALRCIETVECDSAVWIEVDRLMSDYRFFSIRTQGFLEVFIMSFWRFYNFKRKRSFPYINFDRLIKNINEINYLLLYENKYTKISDRDAEQIMRKVGIVFYNNRPEYTYLLEIMKLGSIQKNALPIIRELYEEKELLQTLVYSLKELQPLETEPSSWHLSLEEMMKDFYYGEVILGPLISRSEPTDDMTTEAQEQCRAFSGFSREIGEIVLSNMIAFCNEHTIYLHDWRKNMELFRQLAEEEQDSLIAWLEKYQSIGCRVRSVTQSVMITDKFFEITTYRRLIYIAEDIKKKLSSSSEKNKEKVTEEQLYRFRLMAGNMFSYDAIGEIEYKLNFSAIEWYVWMLFVTAEHNGADHNFVYEKIKSLSERTNEKGRDSSR